MHQLIERFQPPRLHLDRKLHARPRPALPLRRLHAGAHLGVAVFTVEVLIPVASTTRA